MSFQVVDPSTEKLIRTIEETPRAEVEQILEGAHTAFEEWRWVPLEERAAALRTIASVLQERADEWAGLMAEEMGKPLAQGRAEANKSASVCRYYADNGASFLRPEEIGSDASRSYVAFEPLGVVLSIMPWNYPFWQVLRFAAPAVMAGNAIVLKHASNVPGCADAIEGVFAEAGLPDGLFRTVHLQNEAAEALIDRDQIQAVTLTGSTRAGRQVAARAGQALKKVVLELGGSDPYIVLPDADLGVAVDACATSRLNNAGQSCISAKRLIVVGEERAREFTDRLVERFEAAVVGDPRKEGVDVGPLARKDLRDGLHRQVRESIEAGATLELGGVVPSRAGWFYPPTVLSGVGPGMPAYDEELFGHVGVVIQAADEEDAIRIANDSVFGLGGAVFSTDDARAERIARERLNVGSAFVNDFVRSDPRLPFGGVKESGYGRELGRFGIREFVNVKTVWIA